MQIEVKRNSREPVYLQIRDEIREKILNGEYPAGFRLPPERVLAEQLGVNRTTVMNAYRELKADGLADARVGQGTVVLPHLRELAGARSSRAEPPVWRQMFSMQAERIQDTLLRDLMEMAGREDIIAFSAGAPCPELEPSVALSGLESMIQKESGRYALRYTPTEGIGELREMVAWRLSQQGAGTEPEEVMILSGSQQGIDLAARVLIDPGDVVLVEEPSFFSALQIFSCAGARVIGVPVDSEGMQTDLLEQALLRHRPKFIYTMPTYQNPTGAVMSLARRQRMIELAYRYRVLILEDDAYGELRFEGEPLPTLYALDDSSYVIYLGSFSKTVFPGLRIGFMAAPRAVIRQFAMVKQMTDLHAGSLSQAIVARFIRSGDFNNHLEMLKRAYCRRRDLMTEALSREVPPGMFSWNTPGGGFSFWLKLPEGVSSTALLTRAAEKGVTFVPGTAFFTGGRGQDYLRLCFSYAPEELIGEGIRRLVAAVNEAQQQGPGRKRLTEVRPIL